VNVKKKGKIKVYQVGKETKYLKMMHGQPNIKINRLCLMDTVLV